jgi:molybdopterin converting factor small subunit
MPDSGLPGTETSGSIRVRIPTPLRSYTGGDKDVRADGSTVGEALTDLDRRYPGLAFRVVDEQGVMRPHMIVWLHGERCRDLAAPVTPADEVVLMQALSGG